MKSLLREGTKRDKKFQKSRGLQYRAEGFQRGDWTKCLGRVKRILLIVHIIKENICGQRAVSFSGLVGL
ncbi:hypothetical protein CW713_01180 [Methanophagales archaeon]|nr:MAG: hypothetical protein CW713_01180 [Methanophagales archaeon]